ncbi:MAG: glycosyltransferase family 2 protein [bacterium]
MKLSIIIPCYNEKGTILECLQRVVSVDLGAVEKEIIIVDDSSIDGTREILQGIDHGLAKIIFHSNNSGKGLAIRNALNYVTGDVVIIQDADLEYDPNDYRKLLKVINDGHASVVYGSRRLNKANQWSYISSAFGGILLSILTNLLYRSKITDEPTCYKMFKTEVIKGIKLECIGFEFCPEITAKILKRGIDIKEVPISYMPRHIEEGKKINWRDGLVAIKTLIKYRFKD